MKKQETQKQSHRGQVIGAGIAALTTAAVAYFLTGPNGKKNRTRLKGWMIKMKGEIVEKLENVKEITEPIFNKIVDEVARKYKKIKNIDAGDLEQAIEEIKSHWKSLSRESKKSSPGKKKITAKKA